MNFVHWRTRKSYAAFFAENCCASKTEIPLAGVGIVGRAQEKQDGARIDGRSQGRIRDLISSWPGSTFNARWLLADAESGCR